MSGSRRRALSGSLILALPVALVAGLISLFSPCVIPLLPGTLTGAAGAWLFSHTRQLNVVLGVLTILLGVVFLGGIGFLQRDWRIHKVLLALAAVPGSVIPQEDIDSLAVSQGRDNHPSLAPIWDRLDLFSVYGSVWFSAIYTQLMISLVGCIIPRLPVYALAMRAEPPEGAPQPHAPAHEHVVCHRRGPGRRAARRCRGRQGATVPGGVGRGGVRLRRRGARPPARGREPWPTCGGSTSPSRRSPRRWRGALEQGHRLPGPPAELAALDRISYRMHAFGFPVWTFGVLISGPIWAHQAWSSYWNWDPKDVWAFITWVVYAAYLHARATAGWRGRNAALLALVGVATLWFNFIGINFFSTTSQHSYAEGAERSVVLRVAAAPVETPQEVGVVVGPHHARM